MMLQICCLKDTKAEAFMTPFFVPTMGVAFRSLGDEIAVPREGNTLAAHPEDFQLWTLGTYDNDTGKLLSRVELVCECTTLRRE